MRMASSFLAAMHIKCCNLSQKKFLLSVFTSVGRQKRRGLILVFENEEKHFQPISMNIQLFSQQYLHLLVTKDDGISMIEY